MRTTFKMALFALAVGLAAPVAAEDDKEKKGHKGPHKGVVIEWGEEEYHAELVFDKKEGTATVYVYGDHAEFHKKKLKGVDSKELKLVLKTTPPTTVKLVPAPEKDKDRKDDAKGVCTKFVGKDDLLKKEVKHTGTLSAKVGTKPYSGDFKQE